jgi:hypoxanthine-guanine phosphoribosyltransferase
MTPEESWRILETADLLCDETQVRAAIARLATEITARLKDRYPLVLAVMGGSIVFAGNLLPLLRFPARVRLRAGVALRQGHLRRQNRLDGRAR